MAVANERLQPSFLQLQLPNPPRPNLIRSGSFMAQGPVQLQDTQGLACGMVNAGQTAGCYRDMMGSQVLAGSDLPCALPQPGSASGFIPQSPSASCPTQGTHGHDLGLATSQRSLSAPGSSNQCPWWDKDAAALLHLLQSSATFIPKTSPVWHIQGWALLGTHRGVVSSSISSPHTLLVPDSVKHNHKG